MLLSHRKNGLTSLFKEVRAFKGGEHPPPLGRAKKFRTGSLPHSRENAQDSEETAALQKALLIVMSPY